jgi:hypothetical protein
VALPVWWMYSFRASPASALLPALLAQEGGDDPHDEGRFESFTQPDHERGQHQ